VGSGVQAWSCREESWSDPAKSFLRVIRLLKIEE